MSNGSITITADDLNIQPVSYDLIMNSISQSTIARINAPMFNPQTNCRNCGAPLGRFGDCEYCGTKRQLSEDNTCLSDKKAHCSQMEITDRVIRLYAR